MLKRLGIMQGRLIPKIFNKYQCFPAGLWTEEFRLIKRVGISKVEFIFDDFFPLNNPLINEVGIKQIKFYEKKFKIKVSSICADYFMSYPLHEKNLYKRSLNISVLKNLFFFAKKLNVKNIILPCVDSSKLNTFEKYINLIKILRSIEEFIDEKKITLSIEMDLPPLKIKKFLNNFHSSYIGINYDIGNSASLGYDYREEIEVYGKKISETHIKDRKLAGGPVFFGKGNAKIIDTVKFLEKNGYKRDYVFQLYRDSSGYNIFKKQFNLFKKKMNL